MSTNFPPIINRPAYAQVFEAIEAAILSGELEEGAPLPTELELCNQFGVKRSTVREGIRLLEQTGLVRRINAKRLVVARPKVAEAAERTRRSLERHGALFIEVWEAISAMQPPTARLAAINSTESDWEELANITKALQAAEHLSDVVEYGVGYLFAIGGATHNSVINVMLRSLNLLAHSTLDQVIDKLPEAKNRIIRAQIEITKALRARDVEGAQTWMARHVDDLRRGYEVAGLDLDSPIGKPARIAD